MASPRGAIEQLPVESQALVGNALGDPSARTLPVYTPPSYGDGRRYPVVFLLAGFTGTGQSLLNWSAWQETLPQRLDRLITSGALPPCLVALPDCFTRLGGSQYVNSPALGRYADHLCDELVPLVDARLRTLGAGARAIAGKSSGGIGALWQCLERPGLFSAAASQAGDCAFELSLEPSFAKSAIALEQRGGMAAHWQRLAQGEVPTDIDLAQTLANAAAYGGISDEPWGFPLPFDLETGATRPEIFARWLQFDPVVAVVERPQGLRELVALHLEAGQADEFNLQLGARILSRTLTGLGIAHHHGEFPGGHRNTSHRWDVALPYLVGALPRAR